jgi:hypothetical protein
MATRGTSEKALKSDALPLDEKIGREKRAKIYQREQKVLLDITKKINDNPEKYKKKIQDFYAGFMGYVEVGYGTMVTLHGSEIREEIKDKLVKAFNALPKEIKSYLTLKGDEIPTLYRGATERESVGKNDFLSFTSSEEIAKMFSRGGKVSKLDELKGYDFILSIDKVADFAKEVERDATDRWEESVLGRNAQGYLNDWPEEGLPSRPYDTYFWYKEPETNEREYFVFGAKWKSKD